MDSSSDSDTVVINEKAQNSLTSLPEISKAKYELTYKKFMDWQQDNNIESLSETIMLTYFEQLSKIYKSSTLWAVYSMLRTTLSVKNNINITGFNKLRLFLKRKSDNYVAKKSKTLTSEQINRFMESAPDDKYLLTKVALAIGITGACRRKELCGLQIDNLQDLHSALLVKLPHANTKMQRTFVITGKFYEIYKKYANLRPPNIFEKRFFLNYQKGKCTRQVIGINKFGKMPAQVAAFLKLPNPESYTGRCFRRSSVVEEFQTFRQCNYRSLLEMERRMAISAAENPIKLEDIDDEEDSVFEPETKLHSEHSNTSSNYIHDENTTLRNSSSKPGLQTNLLEFIKCEPEFEDDKSDEVTKMTEQIVDNTEITNIETNCNNNDSDTYFCLSLRDSLAKIPKKFVTKAKIEILQIIDKYESVS